MADTAFTALTSDRLVLRRFRPADLDGFVAYRSDPEVARYQSWEAPYLRAEAARFLADLRATHPDTPGEWYQIAVALRQTDQLIGDCAVFVDADDPRQAEIGFTIAPAHQSHGYASEAVRRLLDYLLVERGKHRIHASCDDRNIRSAALLERVGMRREGHLLESTWSKGEWTNDLLFAVLRREWPPAADGRPRLEIRHQLPEHERIGRQVKEVAMGSLPAGRRRPPGRITNLALLVALLLAFATGAGALAAGSAGGRWVAVTHGVVGVAVLLLVPWKTTIIRRGLRRARASRWASLLLAALAAAAILTGLGSATGVLASVGGTRGAWLHVAAALSLLPLVIWHVTARPARPRKTDLSRRTLLRAGALGAMAAGLYATTAAVVRVAGLPGATRRFTGSYDTGSFDPAAMPSTVWLDDRTPSVDPASWRLAVADAAGERELSLDDLAAYDARVRAVLDCTGGWYAEQEWAGVPVAALVRSSGDAKSLLVRSTTGYAIRFPVGDLDRLLLATRVGGAPLAARHGFPLRLVAPGRRGFWWVKWVDRIELQDTPWWWQPPFPLT